MLYLKLNTEESQSFKVPERWGEVSYEVYCEYTRILDERKEGEDISRKIYSLFTGLPDSVWDMDIDSSVFSTIDSCLSFLVTTEELTIEVPDFIEREGKYYEVPKSFDNLSLGKYRDIVEIINLASMQETNYDRYRLAPKAIAVLACIDYDTEEELDKIAKDIFEMPCGFVNSVYAFFLTKLNQSKIGTREKWSQEKRELEELKGKLDMTRFLKILVSSIHYITYHRRMLLNLMRSWSKKFREYIGYYNYRVESLSLKGDIVKLKGRKEI